MGSNWIEAGQQLSMLAGYLPFVQWLFDSIVTIAVDGVE